MDGLQCLLNDLIVSISSGPLPRTSTTDPLRGQDPEATLRLAPPDPGPKPGEVGPAPLVRFRTSTPPGPRNRAPDARHSAPTPARDHAPGPGTRQTATNLPAVHPSGL